MELDLSWITEELAIGAAFAVSDVGVLAHQHHVRAIVDLREEQCDDRGVLRRHGIQLLHLPTPDHHPISDPMLAAGCEFIAQQRAAQARVLVHCQYGIGRSVLLGLCALVDAGYSPLDALTLAKRRRSRCSPSLAQYEAWVRWLVARGLTAPSFEAFAQIAYARVA